MARRTHCLTVLLGVAALACSEAPPTQVQVPQGGSGGQDTTVAGSGGTEAIAGSTSGGMATGGGGASPTSGGGGAGGDGGSAAGSAGAAGAAGLGGSGGSGGGADDGWIPLFNGMNLDGWTTSQDHAGLFGVSQLEGEGVLHVYPTQADQSSQPEATIRTNDSFSKYVFHVQYKWGTKRYGSRSNSFRDNGICFHLCGNPGQVWPESIELQIGAATQFPHDWITGNIFMLINKTRAQWPYTNMNGTEVWSATGTKKSIGAPASYYRAHVPAQLNKDDDWNTIELTVNGSEKAEYKVNGTVVNEVFDMECNANGTWEPLTQGPIALQAEYAETYFRDIRIKMLP